MQLEYRLRTEIEFLRDMIENQGNEMPQDLLSSLLDNKQVAETELAALIFDDGVTLH